MKDLLVILRPYFFQYISFNNFLFSTTNTQEPSANEGWADFVFALDYELMTLKEVEAFINKNGHLPAVPSAKEAIKNGMDVAQTNILLLQKVEELTLYLIQKDKEVSDLEKRLSSLEAKLN